MGKFSERYKELKTAELLLILERPEDYQPEAVADAQAELANRRITDADRELLGTMAEEAGQERQKAREQKEKWEQGQTSLVRKLMNLIYPIDQVSRRTHIIIGIILIMGSIGALEDLWYTALFMYDSIASSMQDEYFEWSYAIALIFAVINGLLLPIAVLLLWVRKPFGWSLLIFIMLQIVYVYITSQYFNYLTFPPQYIKWPEPTYWQTVRYVISALAYPVIMLILLLHKDVREAFHISRKRLSFSLAISLLLLLTGFLVSFYIMVYDGNI